MHTKLFAVLKEKSAIFESVKEDSIFNLMTNASMPPETHDQLLNVEKIGQALHEEFAKERLQVDSSVSIWAPIKLAKLPRFTLLNKKVHTFG